MAYPTFSIVINTSNRCESLQVTLKSLEYLDYPVFEVVIVVGPDDQETVTALGPYAGRIVLGQCPEHNLSRSRNIGIELASGELVAFLDDDAVPDPLWLQRLAAAYDPPSVAGVGGFTFDHTGAEYQARYLVSDRAGFSEGCADCPTLPGDGSRFFSLLGTNSSFRREALLGISGFDEHYRYFLDETDVCLRLADAGFRLVTAPEAVVFHKGAPSVRRSFFNYARSQAYFTARFFPREPREQFEGMLQRVRMQWLTHLEHAAVVHRFSGEQLLAGQLEIERGFTEGLTAGLLRPALRPLDPGRGRPLTPFRPRFEGRQRLCLCFASQEFPPDGVGGIARYTADLTHGLAERGHDVHVITHARDKQHRVEWIDGVWIHRVPVEGIPRAATIDPSVPAWPAARSSAVLFEVERLGRYRKVDAVFAPIYDLEGVAFLRQHKVRLITWIQTTHRLIADDHPERAHDQRFLQEVLLPLVHWERVLLLESPRLIFSTEAMINIVERVYETKIPRDRVTVLPYGLQDHRLPPTARIRTGLDGTVQVLYVGRFEPRKGIDVLFVVIPSLCAEFPKARFRLVGAPPDNQYAAAFRQQFPALCNTGQVVFPGVVSDEELLKEYAAADILVAPSRFESFGLIYLEAMMQATACVGCRTGGIPEVIAENETGLLVEPGDAASLRTALARLIADRALRERLGAAGRDRFEQEFSLDSMVENVERVVINAEAPTAWLPPRDADRTRDMAVQLLA